MAALKSLHAATRPPWTSWSNGYGRGRPLHASMTWYVTNVARTFPRDLPCPDPTPCVMLLAERIGYPQRFIVDILVLGLAF